MRCSAFFSLKFFAKFCFYPASLELSPDHTRGWRVDPPPSRSALFPINFHEFRSASRRCPIFGKVLYRLPGALWLNLPYQRWVFNIVKFYLARARASFTGQWLFWFSLASISLRVFFSVGGGRRPPYMFLFHVPCAPPPVSHRVSLHSGFFLQPISSPNTEFDSADSPERPGRRPFLSSSLERLS